MTLVIPGLFIRRHRQVIVFLIWWNISQSTRRPDDPHSHFMFTANLQMLACLHAEHQHVKSLILSTEPLKMCFLICDIQLKKWWVIDSFKKKIPVGARTHTDSPCPCSYQIDQRLNLGPNFSRAHEYFTDDKVNHSQQVLFAKKEVQSCQCLELSLVY